MAVTLLQYLLDTNKVVDIKVLSPTCYFGTGNRPIAYIPTEDPEFLATISNDILQSQNS